MSTCRYSSLLAAMEWHIATHSLMTQYAQKVMQYVAKHGIVRLTRPFVSNISSASFPVSSFVVSPCEAELGTQRKLCRGR